MTEQAAASVMGSCFSDKFKQQQLPAWRPLFTPGPVLATMWTIGAVFLAVAVAALVTDADLHEVVVPYGERCGNRTPCTLDIELKQPLRLPVFIYYELTNYHQNYRLYAKSRNQDQLEGEVVTSLAALSDCSPLDSVNHSSNVSNFYFPCGLIAWSQFNDTFELGADTATNGTVSVPLRKHGIAWESDRKMYSHDPGANITGVRVVPDITDEDFLVWMRVAAFPDFRKLYRVIDRDAAVEAGLGTELNGTLRLTVENNYPVSAFGTKSLVLTELSWLGGKNAFIGWLYVAVGAAYLIFAGVFTAKQLVSPRKFADTRLLPWDVNAPRDGDYVEAASAADVAVEYDSDNDAQIVEMGSTHARAAFH